MWNISEEFERLHTALSPIAQKYARERAEEREREKRERESAEAKERTMYELNFEKIKIINSLKAYGGREYILSRKDTFGPALSPLLKEIEASPSTRTPESYMDVALGKASALSSVPTTPSTPVSTRRAAAKRPSTAVLDPQPEPSSPTTTKPTSTAPATQPAAAAATVKSSTRKRSAAPPSSSKLEPSTSVKLASKLHHNPIKNTPISPQPRTEPSSPVKPSARRRGRPPKSKPSSPSPRMPNTPELTPSSPVRSSSLRSKTKPSPSAKPTTRQRGRPPKSKPSLSTTMPNTPELKPSSSVSSSSLRSKTKPSPSAKPTTTVPNKPDFKPLSPVKSASLRSQTKPSLITPPSGMPEPKPSSPVKSASLRSQTKPPPSAKPLTQLQKSPVRPLSAPQPLTSTKPSTRQPSASVNPPVGLQSKPRDKPPTSKILSATQPKTSMDAKTLPLIKPLSVPTKKNSNKAHLSASSDGDDGLTCSFCNLGKDTTEDGYWGDIIKISKKISAHENCLFYSSGLVETSNPNCLTRFDPKDVTKELKRGSKLKCRICKKSGATVGCENRRCGAVYHYPCTTQLMGDNFQTSFTDKANYMLIFFCPRHAPKQESPDQKVLDKISPEQKLLDQEQLDTALPDQDSLDQDSPDHDSPNLASQSDGTEEEKVTTQSAQSDPDFDVGCDEVDTVPFGLDRDDEPDKETTKVPLHRGDKSVQDAAAVIGFGSGCEPEGEQSDSIGSQDSYSDNTYLDGDDYGQRATLIPPPREKEETAQREESSEVSDSDSDDSNDEVAMLTPLKDRFQRYREARPFRKRTIIPLEDWVFKVTSDQSVIVEGHRKEDDPHVFWHSSNIEIRLNSRVLETTSGATYRLKGAICESEMISLGYSDHIIRKFHKGFPPDWKVIIQDMLDEEKRVKELAMQKRMASIEARKVEKRQRWDQEQEAATPSTSKNQTTPKSTPKLRSTRSGRTVIPPLDFWMGERIESNMDHIAIVNRDEKYMIERTPERTKTKDQQQTQTVEERYNLRPLNVVVERLSLPLPKQMAPSTSNKTGNKLMPTPLASNKAGNKLAPAASTVLPTENRPKHKSNQASSTSGKASTTMATGNKSKPADSTSTAIPQGNNLLPALKTKITGKPGTLKRRREMNQLMKEVHKGYQEIPTFEEDEEVQTQIKIPRMDTLIADLDAESDEDEKEKESRTPFTRLPRPRPYSGAKTPAAHYSPPSESPTTQERKNQERYVHSLVEKNRKYQKKKENKSQASAPLPRKKTVTSAIPLFSEDIFSDVVVYAGNSDTDNDENTDYYFSDDNEVV